ncbi:MAG: endonuclease/exonuclease/phosphatase family protein [Bryobacteraceae bacterium]
MMALFWAAVILFAGTAPNLLDRIWRGDFTAARPLGSIRAADWNIDRGVHLDEIAAGLDRDRPDLCLLQEVDLFDRRSRNRNVAQALAQKLKLNYAVVASFQELSQASDGEAAYQGEAILTRLPVERARVIRFHEQSGFWRPRSFIPNIPIMQRRAGGRTVLVVELKSTHGMLVVYDAHLESRSLGRIQLAQLREILEDTRRYPAGTPVILAGDFNTKYNSAAVFSALQAAGFRSAFPDGAPRTHRIEGKLDWLLVRGPARIEDAMVDRNARGSDHFPIFARIEVGGNR